MTERDGLPRLRTAAEFNAAGAGTLPGLLGIEVVELSATGVRSRLTVRPELLAPIGYLHAATVVALADTTAGYGCWANLPTEAIGFTTIELKSNFLGTAREGIVTCAATLVHGGRSTQVWDATVRSAATEATIALFRCTQLLFSPRS